MAKRQLAERQYTQVAMPDEPSAAAALMPAAARIGSNLTELVQARDRMNMNNMLSDTNTELAAVTAKWQTENASNPFDPEAAEKLKQEYGEIFNKYGQQVSVLSRGDWTEAQGKLTSQYVQSNMRWAMGQAVKNAEASVNMSFEKGNQFAYQSGVAGTDVGLVNGNYAARADMIRKSLSTIGQSDVQIEETLSNHKSDYMKNYVTGAIYRNPENGEKLLQDKDVINDIGSPEAIQSLNSYASRRKQEIKLETIRANDATAAQDLNTLYDETVSFSQKMADIEEKQLRGVYSPSMAASMRRVLTRRESVNAVTDNASRSDILQRTSDAYTAYQADGDEEAYFEKMSQIREAVTQLNAEGKYNSKEILKLNNQISQMTRKANSDAAREIEYDTTYGDAIAFFKENVPSSLRDTALREYFQKADEAVMPQDKARALMSDIATRLSADNRNNAIEVATKAFAEKQVQTGYFQVEQDGETIQFLAEVDENGKPVKFLQKV